MISANHDKAEGHSVKSYKVDLNFFMKSFSIDYLKRRFYSVVLKNHAVVFNNKSKVIEGREGKT